MAPDAIVKHLDVFEDHPPGPLTGSETVVMQAFRFDRAREAGHRVRLRVTAGGSKTYISETKLNGKTICITIGGTRTWMIGDAQTEATRLKGMTLEQAGIKFVPVQAGLRAVESRK